MARKQTAHKTARSRSTQPKLTMKYAGGLVKHLGLQMYSGAVPSIAELVKNAYDANASEVEIKIPFDKAWERGSTIEVRDYGVGMSFAECDSKYLAIGRDRRSEGGDVVEGSTTRRPIGRKALENWLALESPRQYPCEPFGTARDRSSKCKIGRAHV